MIVRFVVIGGIIDNHCLNFLFIIEFLAAFSSLFNNLLKISWSLHKIDPLCSML